MNPRLRVGVLVTLIFTLGFSSVLIKEVPSKEVNHLSSSRTSEDVREKLDRIHSVLLLIQRTRMRPDVNQTVTVSQDSLLASYLREARDRRLENEEGTRRTKQIKDTEGIRSTETKDTGTLTIPVESDGGDSGENR